MGLEHDSVTSKTFLTFRKRVFLTEILSDSFVALATAVTFKCEYIEFFLIRIRLAKTGNLFIDLRSSTNSCIGCW
jgi:hypothetical protein